MRVAETRKTPYGIKRRRYKRPGLQDLTTYEIPETVARAIGMKAIRRWMSMWERGEEKREMSRYRREFIRQRIEWKPEAMANELGISVNRVQFIVKQLKNEEDDTRNSGRDARCSTPRQVHRDPADDGRDD